MRLLPRSIRGRLWAALALLSLAILGVSTLTWVALQLVDTRLQDLHQRSLSQVAQAIDLSKRSSDLATSAPYLLNQRSNFLIEREGEKLIEVLARVREDWPETGISETGAAEVFEITGVMENAVRDLVTASRSLDAVQTDLRNHVTALSALRDIVTTRIEARDTSDGERLVWWTLQGMNADMLSAAYADNLIGVGEDQRLYQRRRGIVTGSDLTTEQGEFLSDLDDLATGDKGIFELRRAELGINLAAQNALFRIRHEANQINELARGFADQAEAILTDERSSSSSTIQLTRLSVAAISLVSLAVALVSALYVSRYVAFNIARVSDAMVRLAHGDRTSVLPRRSEVDDEIGDLFQSFRRFRADALRLDRSNRQLDQRNALFEKVFANISDGIVLTDSTGKLTASNPAVDRILATDAASEISGSFVDWLRGSHFAEAVFEAGLSDSHRGYALLVSASGQTIELRSSRLPDEGRVWLISDVTEQRNIAARLEQIDRIETLGKLAGDTAHDFGNILSTIRTHTHLLGSDKADRAANIAAIENAVEFGSSLTARLLAFARRQPLAPEIVDLNALVEGMSDLVEIGLKKNVSIKVSYSTTTLEVLADPGHLESALFNLVLNANNAILGEGVIQIALSEGSADVAEIVISDNGSGMSQHTREKAIEPFFTTRAGEGGTGLGLSIVHGFIKQSGGELEIESEEDNGTVIRLYLPLAPALGQSLSVASGGAALVVDDNVQERIATTRLLTDLGYTVKAFATLKEGAMALRSDLYDVIVSDLDLGTEETGASFLQLAASVQPDARRILISGKSNGRDVVSTNEMFIEKPLERKRLSQILDQTLISNV